MLLDRNGTASDPWTHSDGAAIGNIPLALVPWEALPEALANRAPGQQIGVVVPGSLAIAEVEALLPELALIAVGFPAYSDGRGFSLARRLRRAGFAGRLRASGPLIVDQFAYVLFCGFDEIALPASSAGRQPAEQWQRVLSHVGARYQRGYGDGGNILDQRRAKRLVQAAG
ncbi:DUF934 domain-containing protein [Bosea rubneri]|uniref:DUF934 domain-containing protein n=1 Tax=Bosea rubneri TaxID=3075434 RepID=A0ABU3SAT8_9HYPH|nr:DUF934 domain-containing protein [Bosea sp. ZW T0_25]MDU0341475.1 DUF934 domain-containing protein [Bosea sp. ZW T0_25]